MRQSPGGCLLVAGARAFPQEGKNPLAPRGAQGLHLICLLCHPHPTFPGCASLKNAIQRLSPACAAVTHIELRIAMSEHLDKTYT